MFWIIYYPTEIADLKITYERNVFLYEIKSISNSFFFYKAAFYKGGDQSDKRVIRLWPIDRSWIAQARVKRFAVVLTTNVRARFFHILFYFWRWATMGVRREQTIVLLLFSPSALAAHTRRDRGGIVECFPWERFFFCFFLGSFAFGSSNDYIYIYIYTYIAAPRELIKYNGRGSRTTARTHSPRTTVHILILIITTIITKFERLRNRYRPRVCPTEYNTRARRDARIVGAIFTVPIYVLESRGVGGSGRDRLAFHAPRLTIIRPMSF